jgi:hypothetical protein
MQTFFKVALFIVGSLAILAGLFAMLIVINMIQHPGGIGMEWIAGPVVGVVGLAFFAGGAAIIHVAAVMRKSSAPAQLAEK